MPKWPARPPSSSTCSGFRWPPARWWTRWQPSTARPSPVGTANPLAASHWTGVTPCEWRQAPPTRGPRSWSRSLTVGSSPEPSSRAQPPSTIFSWRVARLGGLGLSRGLGRCGVGRGAGVFGLGRIVGAGWFQGCRRRRSGSPTGPGRRSGQVRPDRDGGDTTRPGSTGPITPPCHHGMTWWASHSEGRAWQPGNTQPPSRNTSAARRSAGTSRWSLPTSSTVLGPPSTAGSRSASQHNRRRSPALSGSPSPIRPAPVASATSLL